MRIVHGIHSLHPRHGGPPLVAASLAAAQAGLGHDVTLLSYDEGEDLADVARQVPGLDAVDVRRLPRGGKVERLTGRAFGAEVRRLRPEVGHFHRVWEADVAAGVAACRAVGATSLVAPHGMLDRWSMAQSTLKKKLALAVRVRRALESADALHVLNDAEVEGMSPLKLTARTEVIANGIWPSVFDELPDPSVFREAFPAVGDRPYVLFMARLHHKKGLDRLIDGMALLGGGPSLVVAGPDDGARAEAETRAAAAGVTAHFTGPLLGDVKYAALAGAAAFGLVSRQEGFSVALLEAMAARVPVVMSAACNFPEAADAGAGAIVEPDPAAVAAGIEAAVGSAMGGAGRRLVLRDYTWPAVAARAVEAYERLRG